MRNYEDEPWANDFTPTTDNDDDVFANPVEHKMGAEEGHDAEVTRLFVDARDKLEKVEANAIKQKKQIVVDLAKSLEGKIPMDSICMEIINQLRGQVSASFIRQCLDEKYKQKTRVDNARKQQQKQKVQQDEKLATVTSLNQEDAEDKKEVIVVDVDGRMSVQEEDESNDEQPFSTSKEPFTTKDGEYVVEATTTSSQEVEQPPKKQQALPDTQAKILSPKDQDSNSVEPEDISHNSSQIVASNSASSVISSKYINDSDAEDHIIQFEFSLLYGEIRRHMAPLYQKIGDNGKIWFSGKIDKRTREVIYLKLGRTW